MKNGKDNKGKRTSFRRGGIRYACTVVWIIITCFIKHFFKNTSHLFRMRAAAVTCILAAAAVLVVEVSHSSTEVEDAHLVLCMSQKGNEVTEGYEDPVICDLVLENDGGNDLTDVRFYIDGRHEGFSFVLEEGKNGDTLPPGGKWRAKVVMEPGRNEGEYFVPVAAEAEELDERVEQVVRFVVKEAAEPSGTPDIGRPSPTEGSPEPEKTPAAGTTPEPGGSPEPGTTPEPGGSPEPGRPPVSVQTEKPEVPEKTEDKKPDMESGPAEKKKPGIEKTDAASKEALAQEQKSRTPKPKPSKTGKPTESPVREASSAEAKGGDAEKNDDIIRVDVPTNARLFMNPMALEENGQISSSRLPITNHSDFPLDIEIRRGVLDIRQNGGLVRKNCTLNMDILRKEQVIVAIRNLREGINPIHTSFLLPSGNTAYIRFFGSVDAGTEYLWEDGDLKANILFCFSKSKGK